MHRELPPLIDSHCHLHNLDLHELGGSLESVLQEAKEHGVQHMLCVCIDDKDVPILYDLANRYPNVSISVGVHPNITMDEPVSAEDIIAWSKHPSCIAIGETGLDYYRSESETEKIIQQARFREHIRAALSVSKPLIIHTRDAAEDTLRLLAEEGANNIGGVMHCFSENWEVARRAIDLNFYISFSGIVTFKNATTLQEVAKKVPLDRILIETDAPYLAPVPFRGRQNHPALVKYVAEAISQLRQIDFAECARQTTENFNRCFRKTQ